LEAKKDRGTGFSVFFPREKWGESQKSNEGVGEGNEGTFPSFPSPSFHFLALAPFFRRAGKTPKISFL